MKKAAPEVKEQAKLQVLMYWKKLSAVAESITDTEVRLTLPGRKTPKGCEFAIEGIVDIVREKGRTVMYDLKTHDPTYVKTNIGEYRNQLNVYAYIWQALREQALNEMAIIATQVPDEISGAVSDPDASEERLLDALERWNPIIDIGFDENSVEATIDEFGATVDAIEDGRFSPPNPKRLHAKVHAKETFASRICGNCDIRFSCRSYGHYSSGKQSSRS